MQRSHQPVSKRRHDGPLPCFGHLQIPYKIDSQACDNGLNDNVENANDGPSDTLRKSTTSVIADPILETIIDICTYRTVTMLAYHEPGS